MEVKSAPIFGVHRLCLVPLLRGSRLFSHVGHFLRRNAFAAFEARAVSAVSSLLIHLNVMANDVIRLVVVHIGLLVVFLLRIHLILPGQAIFDA